MALLTISPLHSPNSSPLRHPSYRSPQQKTSPSFTDRWRNRMRSDLVERVKSARENSHTKARGGDEEIERVIFRGEEKRRQARMEREASLIHRETLDSFDESEESLDAERDPEEVLLEELLRKEEEEVLALLAAMEEASKEAEDLMMEDVMMEDININEG